MNENKTLGNILFGVGSFIIGFPVAFFFLIFSALAGFSLGHALALVLLYGIIGYFLGKMRANLGWKMGLFLGLGMPVSFGIFWYLKRIVDFGDSSVLLLVISFSLAAIIIGMITSRYGSHSQKPWDGKVSRIIFTIIILILLYYTSSFFIGGFGRAQNSQVTPVLPPQPTSN